MNSSLALYATCTTLPLTRLFVEALQQAGIDATLVRAVGKTHLTLNQDMG